GASNGEDQRTAGLLEEPGDLGVVPGGIAEFEGRAVPAWQPGHKLFEPRRIGTPVGRELVEARPEPLAEPFGRGHEPLQGLVDVAELLQVRDVPARLDGEEEAGVRCRLLGPGAELVAGGLPVEAPVDLDGREVLRVVRELILSGKIGRVEALDPVRVDPAGSADPDHFTHPIRTILILVHAMLRTRGISMERLRICSGEQGSISLPEVYLQALGVRP